MFGVLMFLFESYISGQFNFQAMPDDLNAKLRHQGFRQDEIAQALDWVGKLPKKDKAETNTTKSILEAPPIHTQGMRVFSGWESTRLSSDARGLLFALEQCGILDSRTRELVIEQALALDIDYIDCLELKLIVLMVLGAHLESNRDIVMLQEFILSDQSFETLH
jgi:uncharacterized protein Smg (DUF494 family)